MMLSYQGRAILVHATRAGVADWSYRCCGVELVEKNNCLSPQQVKAELVRLLEQKDGVLC
jgi:hypothetical protein